MADRSGRCDDKCGCTVPCPGGTTCRCTTSSVGTGREEAHSTCTCGEHCGCNPCKCGKVATSAGGSSCTCGTGCSCATCKA